MKGTYKYHYIIKRNGAYYDRAQDVYMLCAVKRHLVQMYGLAYAQDFTFERERISKEEWKQLYC